MIETAVALSISPEIPSAGPEALMGFLGKCSKELYAEFKQLAQ